MYDFYFISIQFMPVSCFFHRSCNYQTHSCPSGPFKLHYFGLTVLINKIDKVLKRTMRIITGNIKSTQNYVRPALYNRTEKN